MVELLGGTIECKSRQGEGTTFTIVLDIPKADRQRDAIEALKKLPGIVDELRRAFRELIDKIHERNIESLKEIYGEHKEEKTWHELKKIF